ncbi:2-keto-4-pentenoate hydratase [Amphritea pacifica]|uniref:Hydratase n=1 Tax=Amphritea pacifica TaxID=2811233 RepID=A0ABS2W4Z3_9GAMM|nr:hypothetical protein [Amphritea pacifica]MBN0986770.1 hypothetical protein [Amphritea pacifica]MBN1007151.1 hypothetical protein [Amphritea pacifica]
MQQTDIQAAAQALLTRRLNRQITGPLPAEQRPVTVEQALAIQQSLMQQMALAGQGVGGWKCALPIAIDGLENVPVIAPIFSSSIYTGSPCPIQLDQGVCKIEPEIGFRFGRDLPHRQEPYGKQEILDALSGAHLALELILSRYAQPDSISYLEHLADCLFNQGLFVGPQISVAQALTASEISFVLTQGIVDSESRMEGKHPSGYPQTPLFWLVNCLSQQGIDIKAGQVVITSSYAGVIEVAPEIDFTLEYEKYGEISLRFKIN